jgi:hypothetical protein
MRRARPVQDATGYHETLPRSQAWCYSFRGPLEAPLRARKMIRRYRACVSDFNPRSVFEASAGVESGTGLDACVACSTVRVVGSISEVRNRRISGCDMPSRPTKIF